MIISDGSGTIEVQYLYSSILIKMNRYNVYLKPKKLVKLKNLLLDCLRTLRENTKNKALSDWLKEKSSNYSVSPVKNTMIVDIRNKEVCIQPPTGLRTIGPIGHTTLNVYLGLKDLNCFIRLIKCSILKIRLDKKAKQKCQ